MQQFYCNKCTFWTPPRMETLRANERRQNIQTVAKSPPSLFEICASMLWKPRTTVVACHSLIYNCKFCLLAASHLARGCAAIGSLEEFNNINAYAESYSDEPGLDFYLNCRKEIVKKFVVLHILYQKNQISNNFTSRLMKSNFMYKITLRGTNSISLGTSRLITCYEIFVLYLSQHLRWFSRLEKNVPLNEVPRLKITCQTLATPSRGAYRSGFSLHAARPVSSGADSSLHIQLNSDPSSESSVTGYSVTDVYSKLILPPWQCAGFVVLTIILCLLLYLIVPNT